MLQQKKIIFKYFNSGFLKKMSGYISDLLLLWTLRAYFESKSIPFLWTPYLLLVISNAPSLQSAALRLRRPGPSFPSFPSPTPPPAPRSLDFSMSAMENGVRFLSSVIRSADVDGGRVRKSRGTMRLRRRLRRVFGSRRRRRQRRGDFLKRDAPQIVSPARNRITTTTSSNNNNRL